MNHYRHLYIHIPFCDVICHYCHFYTARTAETDQRTFFASLKREAQKAEHKWGEKLEAVYFGGGTPASSNPDLLADFLAQLGPRIDRHTEITLEANPSNVSKERVRLWKEAGVNRISLGVQSLNDTVLKRLGRAHSVQEARASLEACKAEIENVSCDLIYAVPEQGEEEPAHHALELHRLGAVHVSLYHLTLEPSHFLYSDLPPGDFAWKQLRKVSDVLKGFHHYEVASFALPGQESRNNRNYWSGGPYFALGPSSHGFDGGFERWTHVSDWREYVRRSEQGESTRTWTETLTQDQRRMEILLTRLRTSEGLDLAQFRDRFGEDLEKTRAAWLSRWAEEGLAKLQNGRLILTFQGRMLADEITKALL